MADTETRGRILTVTEASVSFGGLQALSGASLEGAAGRVTSVIGPNGAGKTTLFNAITGHVALDKGEITHGGKSLVGMPPHHIAREGLLRTFQSTRLFVEMPVIDNLLVAAPDMAGEDIFSSWARRRRVRDDVRDARAEAEEVMSFVGLNRLRDDLAGSLSGGQRKLLELGRALMRRPDTLLLDEPVAGVHPALVLTIAEKLRELAARGLTLVVIEHNLEFVMDISDTVYAMTQGRVIASGDPEHVRNDPGVRSAYLGEAV